MSRAAFCLQTNLAALLGYDIFGKNLIFTKNLLNYCTLTKNSLSGVLPSKSL